jgi:hypothetical protein
VNEALDNRARELIQLPLLNLPEIAASEPEEPKFVFVHIPAAHAPLVFGPNGEKNQITNFSSYQHVDVTYQQKYTDQIQYINRLVGDSINGILSNSPISPIIIIQSDHGPQAQWSWVSPDAACLIERFSILNAYYLPGDVQQKLYPSISPVNTFRLIFKDIFNADLDLVEDRFFFSPYGEKSHFIDVTDRVNTCAIP